MSKKLTVGERKILNREIVRTYEYSIITFYDASGTSGDIIKDGIERIQKAIDIDDAGILIVNMIMSSDGVMTLSAITPRVGRYVVHFYFRSSRPPVAKFIPEGERP